MNKEIKQLALAITLLLVFATAVSAETSFETAAGEKVSATLSFDANPLKTMTEIPFRFELTAANNDMIQTAACDLTMPAMPMPDNHPDLVCKKRQCTGVAIFTMAGAWQATFGLLLSDGTHSSLVFDIPMVKMK